MSPTETHADRSTALATDVWHDVLVPIADARRTAQMPPYFPAWRDATASTYYERPGVSRMSPADFEFPGGGSADGLIDALAAHWRSEGELALASAAAKLKAIADALRVEDKSNDGSVDIFCYTLF